MNLLLRTFCIGLLALLLSACDSSTQLTGGDPIEAETVSDLPADPIIGFDPNTGQPVGTGEFTFFSLRTGTEVADSASTDWDLAFRGTEIRINGGTSGPGNGAALVFTGAFEDLAQAPEAGYSTDSQSGNAIPLGSGNGWYNYNPKTNLVSPIPGRVLVVMTADGRYAKVRIVSYYRGAPDTPDPTTDEARYYTFDYVFQPDGSRTLAD